MIGLFIFIFAFGCIYAGGWILCLLAFLISTQINTEYINIVKKKNIHPSKWWIRFVSILFLIIASLPFLGFHIKNQATLYVFIFTFGVVGCFFRLVLRGNRNEPIASIADIGASVLGFVYTGLLPTYFLLVRQLGFIYVIITIVSVAYCDVGAYFGGKIFGKNALKPEISPKKTFEGSISGFLTSFFMAIILVYTNQAFFHHNIFHGVMIGIITGVFSQFGDLFESMLKRDAGVKDSGTLLLSHGGLLDRVDSYIFVFWAVYFYINWVVKP